MIPFMWMLEHKGIQGQRLVPIANAPTRGRGQLMWGIDLGYKCAAVHLNCLHSSDHEHAVLWCLEGEGGSGRQEVWPWGGSRTWFCVHVLSHKWLKMCSSSPLSTVGNLLNTSFLSCCCQKQHHSNSWRKERSLTTWCIKQIVKERGYKKLQREFNKAGHGGIYCNPSVLEN